MFFSFFKPKSSQLFYQQIVNTVGMKMERNYYSEKYITKIETNGKKFFPYPFCMNCLHYVPIEHSSLLHSGCGLFKPLKRCVDVRHDKALCAKEGKYFQEKE